MKRIVLGLISIVTAFSIVLGSVIFDSSFIARADSETPLYFYKGHTYAVFDQMKMSWDEAEEYCESLGGHLATISSQGEQYFISCILEENTNRDDDSNFSLLYFLGGKRSLSGSSWSWVTDENFTYSNWNINEETEYREDRLAIALACGLVGDLGVTMYGLGEGEDDDLIPFCWYSTESWENSPMCLWLGFVCEWEHDEKANILFRNYSYVTEHLNFVNSDTYSDLMNYYRFSDNLIDKEDFNNKLVAGVVWDLFGDIAGLFKNPFSAVLADLITSYTTSQTLEAACYNEALDVFNKTYDNFMKAIKTSDEWDASLEPKIKTEVRGILTDPNYKIKDKASFDVLKKILKGWNSSEISEVFDLLNVANDIFDTVDTIGEIGSSFTKAVNAYVTAAAFQNVSEEFTETLLLIAHEMSYDSIPASFFYNAIYEYTDLLDGESAFTYALENLAGSLAWTSYGLVFKKLVQNTAYSFVANALGCAPSAVGIIIFTYNTTYSILNQVTALGDKADLLYLIDAAIRIEDGLYSYTKSAANSLLNKQDSSSAESFDCCWGMLSAIQKYEYSCAVKYASKASLKTRIIKAFNSNYESNDMRAASELSSYWENAKCHGNASVSGKLCSVECPTNVTVKNSSGDIALLIEGNDIITCSEGITVLVGDDHKYFSLPADDLYDIEIVGTGEGTMDYTVTELKESNTVREVQYKEVPLSVDLSYSGVVSNVLYDQAENYNLKSDNADINYISDSIEDDSFSCNDLDWDEDGLTNIEEYRNKTDSANPDTDGDNVYDLVEIWYGLNPLEPFTDGETDDYILVYGTPDVYIDESSFAINETDVTCTIRNKAGSKAMRTRISLYIDNTLVDSCMANFDEDGFVDYTFSKDYLVDGMKIVIDEEKITRDINYKNNEFIYIPITGIEATDSEITIIKGNTIQLKYVLAPINSTDIIEWKSLDDNVVSVDNNGLITAVDCGNTTVTATAPTGISCKYNISVRTIDDIVIQLSTPEYRTINYGESVKLYANVTNLPKNHKIMWKTEGSGVEIKPSTSGKFCVVTSTSTGNVVVKAYVVDSNGKTVTDENDKPICDSEYFYSEASLWLRIVYFFKMLFKINNII